LREALANAFVHRDYSVGGGSVNVALYEDRLEIISIGDLHFGLTPEALFREHESKPWNPMIARTFYRRGIIETWGRGTLKIARLMQERVLEPLAVAVRQGAVVITFVLPAPVKTPEKSQTQEKTQEKTREKTAAAILRMLGEQPEMSVAELAERLGKVPSTIERAVRKLRESGRLARIGPDKGGHWQVIE
jgi:ATP-dependent DNA helicase RecG